MIDEIQILIVTKMNKKIFIITTDTFEISLSYILCMHYSMYNIVVFKIVDELKRKKIFFSLNFVLYSNFNLACSLYFTLYWNIIC